jgi:hypothetical protein
MTSVIRNRAAVRSAFRIREIIHASGRKAKAAPDRYYRHPAHGRDCKL